MKYTAVATPAPIKIAGPAAVAIVINLALALASLRENMPNWNSTKTPLADTSKARNILVPVAIMPSMAAMGPLYISHQLPFISVL